MTKTASIKNAQNISKPQLEFLPYLYTDIYLEPIGVRPSILLLVCTRLQFAPRFSDLAYLLINKDMRNHTNRGILQTRQPTIPKIVNAQKGSLPVPPKSGPSRGIIKVKVPGIPTNLH